MRKIIQGIVPEKVVRRGKQGFYPPITEWIKNEKYILTMKKAIKNIAKIDDEMAGFLQDKVLKKQNIVYTQYRIRLFLFSIWWEKWISS